MNTVIFLKIDSLGVQVSIPLSHSKRPWVKNYEESTFQSKKRLTSEGNLIYIFVHKMVLFPTFESIYTPETHEYLAFYYQK
jgi:hypothetical protein